MQILKVESARCTATTPKQAIPLTYIFTLKSPLCRGVGPPTMVNPTQPALSWLSLCTSLNNSSNASIPLQYNGS